MVKRKIIIDDKSNCCGCAACVQICPQECISFKEDKEGFRYPIIDNNKVCLECGLCASVCPIINHVATSFHNPLNVYAAKNKDEEIRIKSSSGGVFTLLAENTIREGGVVFGAKFDNNWEVVHDYTETIDGLSSFRGSKYVQSRIEDNYKKAKIFLQKGRRVLFSGTPCQIAGLKRYLKKDYDNLLCVDFVCHGVPSPKVWRYYVNNLCKKFKAINTTHISDVNFREKSRGWKNFSLLISFLSKSPQEDKVTNIYSIPFSKETFMRLFLENIILRPSCYNCQFRSLSSGADITIGDFWGIEKVDREFDDNKGISLVVNNSEKGKNTLNTKELFLKNCQFEEALKYNSPLVSSCDSHPLRSFFFFLLPLYDNIELLSKICLYYRHNLLYRVCKKIRSILFPSSK